MNQSKLKAILFDLDGTLGGYGVGNGRYLQKVRGELSEQFPQVDFGDDRSFLSNYRQWVTACWGAWVKKELLLERAEVKVYIFEQLLNGFALAKDTVKELAVKLQAGLEAAYPETWLPAPGVLEVLQAAKQRGYTLCVLSNGQLDEQTGKLRDHGLLDSFDHLVVSSDVGVGKPDVRIFEHALTLCGCSAAEALMIGDSYSHDLQPAEQLGMQRIWVYEDAPILGLPDERSVAELRDVWPLIEAFDSTF